MMLRPLSSPSLSHIAIIRLYSHIQNLFFLFQFFLEKPKWIDKQNGMLFLVYIKKKDIFCVPSHGRQTNFSRTFWVRMSYTWLKLRHGFTNEEIEIEVIIIVIFWKILLVEKFHRISTSPIFDFIFLSWYPIPQS